MSQASISFSGNSTVKAMDSGTIHYPTPTFYSLVLALFLITLIVSFILPCITFLLKAPVRFLKAPARFLKAPLRFMHHTVASPSGHLGLDSQPIENYISLDIDSLISSISYVQDQTLHNVKTSNTFPIWFQDDYLSLSRCNDYHTKINSVEGSASVLIFAYQGYMIVKRCRETGSSSAGKGRLNHENRIVEQPREFGFKGVKLGSFGTCSHKTPKIQTGYLDLDFQPIEHHISLDIDSLISSVSYVQDQTLHTVKTNTFPTWFQDDYLSLSRCNDYHKKINSLEDSVIIFAYQGYMIVKRCRETREIDSSSAEENLENRIAEQPREFGFKEVKLGSFGTSSHNTPKIQTATVGTGNHKRDFKVKSLKAAHAARLLEHEKETLRRLRKEAYQTKLAKVKKENKIKMQGNFIKKMEELKKKQERRLLVVEQVRKQKLKIDSKLDENLKGTSIPPPYEYPPIRKKSVPSWASVDCLAMVIPLQQKINPESIFCPNSFCTVEEVLLPWESKNHAYDDD